MTFNELDCVELLEALPADGEDMALAAGARGTVLMVFAGGEAYLVEFCNGEGHTLAMPTLKSHQLRAG